MDSYLSCLLSLQGMIKVQLSKDSRMSCLETRALHLLLGYSNLQILIKYLDT